MYKHYYKICTIPKNEKYFVRKILYNNDNCYIHHEDNLYNTTQLNKILVELNEDEYENIYSREINEQPNTNTKQTGTNHDSFEKDNLIKFTNGFQ
jgi:hypothetical protein